jgi:hypothetical protein
MSGEAIVDSLTEPETDLPGVLSSSGTGQLLRLSRGFSCLFWAMPAMSVAHAAGWTPFVEIRWTIGVLLVGFLPLLWGLWRLRIGGDLSRRWGRHIRRMLLLSVAALYLSPFLAWWSVAPMQPYFAFNTAAHYLVMIALMAGLNRLAGEAGDWMGDAGLRREAKAGLGMVLWLSGCTVVALGWMYHRAGVLEAGLPTVLAHVSQLPREARMLFLLPYAMTAYVMWRAKESALHRMVRNSS